MILSVSVVNFHTLLSFNTAYSSIFTTHVLAVFTKFLLIYFSDTCGLDPPFPHLKLGVNIHGCIIIFCMLYSWNFLLIIMSGYRVLHIWMFWLALHFFYNIYKIVNSECKQTYLQQYILLNITDRSEFGCQKIIFFS